jgi:hypothetical protein
MADRGQEDFIDVGDLAMGTVGYTMFFVKLALVIVAAMAWYELVGSQVRSMMPKASGSMGHLMNAVLFTVVAVAAIQIL